jgi:RimJ/RimL family protein N-acetyltransferase
MQLETARLTLREFSIDDWPAVYAYVADPLVVQYMSFGPSTPEQTRDHLHWCCATAHEQPRRIYELAVVLNTDQRVIGGCTLALDLHDPRQAAFSYLLNRHHWGCGYAVEAMHALFTFGFNDVHLHRVADTCDVRNRASARVMEKLGMRREGHTRETFWKDGHWHDEYLYALLAHEWPVWLGERGR